MTVAELHKYRFVSIAFSGNVVFVVVLLVFFFSFLP